MFILVPRAAILLASTTERELWQVPKAGSPRITDFLLSVQRQKFETITVTIGYNNGQLLRLRVILAPPELSIRGAGQKDRSSGDEYGICMLFSSWPVTFFQRESWFPAFHIYETE